MNLDILKILAIIFVPLTIILFLYCNIIKSENKQPYHIFICHVIAAIISIFIFNKLQTFNQEFISKEAFNIDLGLLSFLTNGINEAKNQTIEAVNANISSAIKIAISIFNVLCSIAGAIGLSSTDKRKSNIYIFTRVLLFEIIGIGLLIGLVIISGKG